MTLALGVFLREQECGIGYVEEKSFEPMQLACAPSPCNGYPFEANTTYIQQVYWCHLHPTSLQV